MIYLDVTDEADDEDARQAAAGIRGVLDGDRDDYEQEYPCHSPNEKRWFHLQVRGFESSGRRYAAIAHFDITEAVLSERETERFEQAIEAAGHAIFITDVDGTITYVNPAFERITEFDAAEAIGRTPSILNSGETDEAVFADLWETILDGDDWEGELINRRQSGTLFDAQLQIAPVIEDGDIREFVAVMTEVSDLNRARRQIQSLNDVLRHDLRTELTVIRGHANLLGEEAEDVETHTGAIVDAVDHLGDIAEKGRRMSAFLECTADPEPTELAPIVRSTVDVARESFPHATFTLDAPEAAMGYCTDGVDWALSELLENAVVHTNDQTPTVAVDVTVGSETVAIAVHDDGPGIPEMEYESFDEEAVTTVSHKSGFGLNVAYWVTRRSGGSLLVSDRDGGGTTVTMQFSLPPEE